MCVSVSNVEDQIIVEEDFKRSQSCKFLVQLYLSLLPGPQLLVLELSKVRLGSQMSPVSEVVSH